MKEIKRISAEHGVKTGNVFHAGDGNLHPCIMFDERDVTQLPKVLAAGEEILKRCIDMGGSATGEHGIGIEKINLMEYAFSPETLNAMRQMRDCFNPTGSFNPAKKLPSARGCVEIGKAYDQAKDTYVAAGNFLRRGAPM